MMLAFWVWAVYFWIRGLKSDRRMGCLALSAFLIALSGLTKYFGIALIPLLIVYSLYVKKGIGQWLFIFLIPVSILAVYNSGTQILYGRGLLSDAGAYATHVKGMNREMLKETIIGLSFMGGCLLPYLFFSPFLLSRIFWVCGFLLTAVAVFATHLYFGGAALMTTATAILLGHMVVFVMTAVCIVAATSSDVFKTRNPEAVLFFLWILGTFIFAVFVHWTINGRSLLPMAPAAAIVLVRRLEARGFLTQGWRKPWPWVLPLIPALAIGLLAAHADRSLADASRNAAAVIRLAAKQSTGALWFGGHWGFQYYMESLGGRPIKAQFRDFKTGDHAVMPVNNTNLFKMPPTIVRLRNSYALQPFAYLTTMNPRLGAGFYTHIWGPLPFAFGSVPPERYDLYEIVKP